MCPTGCAPKLVQLLCSGPLGLPNPSPAQRTAAMLALGSTTAAAPDFISPALLPQLQTLLVRNEHGALSPLDVAIWATPEGLLASEAAAGAVTAATDSAASVSVGGGSARAAPGGRGGAGGRGVRGGRGKEASGTSREQEFKERRLAEEAQVSAGHVSHVATPQPHAALDASTACKQSSCATWSLRAFSWRAFRVVIQAGAHY